MLITNDFITLVSFNILLNVIPYAIQNQLSFFLNLHVKTNRYFLLLETNIKKTIELNHKITFFGQ